MNHRNIDRVRAVIDWVEIQIETQRQTNFQTVQRAFAAALNLPPGVCLYVFAITPNKGGGTCHFSVRIHDVKCHGDIRRVFLKVASELPIRGDWRISKIELALDTYCDDPADQAARFYKFMVTPVSTNRRMYRDFKGSGKAVPHHFESIKRHLTEGWQIGIGNKTDDRYQHIYVKKDDTINGEWQEVEKRARLEIRLSGAALPCETADDWKQCKFEKLADYFRLRELKADLDPLIQTLAEAADQVGERKTRNRREGGIRLHSKATKADPMNESIRQALRDLSKRWKGTGKRGRPTKTGANAACGNSVQISDKNTHGHGEEPTNSNNYTYTTIDAPGGNRERHRQPAARRSGEKSAESAWPIPTDPTHGALNDSARPYEASPEAKS